MIKLQHKSIIFLFSQIFLFFSAQCFGQSVSNIDLKKRTPDKIIVLGGNVLCQPQRNSYSWVAPGEGKLLYAFNEDGTTLWKQSFKTKMNPYLSVGICDMLYVVTKDCFLNMLNPGGSLLWTVQCPFNIVENPLPGKDGRVFVRGKNAIECYGTKGILRWSLKTDAQNIKIPLVELNDGSILMFMAREEDGKSVARRCSPFGVISEEIIFSGKVYNVKSTMEGVLMAFTDGSLGMCSVKKSKGAGDTYSKWVIPAATANLSYPVKFADKVSSDNIEYLISSNPAKISKINVTTGTILNTFQTSLPDTASLRYAGVSVNGIVLCDKKSGYCYSDEGKTVWSATFNTSKRWSYVYPSDTGYLTFCTDNWVIEAYRVKQNIGEKTPKINVNYKKPDLYRNFYVSTPSSTSYLTGPAINSEIKNEMHNAFTYGNKAEDSGEKEELWLNMLSQEINRLYEDWQTSNWSYTSDLPYFQQNLPYTQDILNLTYESGICIERTKLARLMKKINDPSILLCLINCAKTTALDPDGELLAALEYVLKNKVNYKNTTLTDAIADATFEICRYMGRPAFFDKGQEILTYMLYPQFNEATHEKARDVLNKIIAIKL